MMDKPRMQGNTAARRSDAEAESRNGGGRFRSNAANADSYAGANKARGQQQQEALWSKKSYAQQLQKLKSSS